MNFIIEFGREDDGRWIAEIAAMPGVMAYGATRLEAKEGMEALTKRVLEEAAIDQVAELPALTRHVIHWTHDSVVRL